jgi:hypothetical protein
MFADFIAVVESPDTMHDSENDKLAALTLIRIIKADLLTVG